MVVREEKMHPVTIHWLCRGPGEKDLGSTNTGRAETIERCAP